jgi:hypothetical protein
VVTLPKDRLVELALSVGVVWTGTLRLIVKVFVTPLIVAVMVAV